MFKTYFMAVITYHIYAHWIHYFLLTLFGVETSETNKMPYKCGSLGVKL